MKNASGRDRVTVAFTGCDAGVLLGVGGAARGVAAPGVLRLAGAVVAAVLAVATASVLLRFAPADTALGTDMVLGDVAAEFAVVGAIGVLVVAVPVVVAVLAAGVVFGVAAAAAATLSEAPKTVSERSAPNAADHARPVTLHLIKRK